MADFFVASNGNDGNVGSEASPWRTITRVNHGFGGQIRLGDRVRFRRGDTFYGRLIPPNGFSPSSPGWLKIGAYGDELQPRPIISGYKNLNSWTPHSANVWRIDIGIAQFGVTHDGYDGAQEQGDPGFLKVDDVIHGRRRFNLIDIASQWEFYYSGTTLYVYSSANPATLATSIQCSVDGHGVSIRSAVEVADLAIIGHGGHGVQAPGLGVSSRVRVSRCEIAEIGGSVLDGYGAGTTRYGNGIECWIGSHDVVAEFNEIHDCYDVAFTVQGADEGVHTGSSNIKYRHNLVYRNSQSIELWYTGSGAGLQNIDFSYNTCLYAGYGWGADVRPETESRVHVLTFGWNQASNVAIKNNIFYDAYTAYRYSWADNEPLNLVSDNNVIALRTGTLLRYQTTQTIENADAWVQADGREAHSRFAALEASANTNITNSDIQLALRDCDTLSTRKLATVGGQTVSTPIHGYWRSPIEDL